MLDDIVNKQNNTVQRRIKMKPIDVTSESYAECNKDSNEKVPKFKFGDRVRISKYKNIFAKECTQNWSEKVFVVSKTKNTVLWSYVISDLNGEPKLEVFMKKNLKNQIKKNLEQKKYLKEKVINCTSNGKDTTTHLIIGLTKKILNEIPIM